MFGSDVFQYSPVNGMYPERAEYCHVMAGLQAEVRISLVVGKAGGDLSLPEEPGDPLAYIKF
jgi:hypothetical protein